MHALIREPRVLAGMALMVIATIAGALFLQHAAQRISVWQLARPLAAGTALEAGDVRLVEVAVPSGVYAPAGHRVVGRQLAHDLGAGELLPSRALVPVERPYDQVVVPVAAAHLPAATQRGQRVDVWWSPSDAATESRAAMRVLASALVLAVTEAEMGGEKAVLLAVPEPEVKSLVSAVRTGDLDLVRVQR